MTSPEPTRWLPPVPTAPPEPAPEPSPIPVWVPFAVLLAVLLVVNLFGAVIFGVLAATDPEIKNADDLPDGAVLGLTLLQDIVFVFGAWIAIRLVLGQATREEFGLRPVRNRAQAVLLAVAAYGLFLSAQWLLIEIFGEPSDQELVTDIKQEDAFGILLGYGVLICVVAPVVEELFFRGFMFTVLARRLGVAWAALIDGLVFGLGHAPAPVVSLIALGVFGVGLCLLYWRTQSIIPCMALHALNNSITFGVVKSLEPALFAGVVLLSVGTVVAGAAALSARPRVAA